MIDEKSTEINKYTSKENELVNYSNETNLSSKCIHCGAYLSSEELFCPYCGQNNGKLIEGEVSDAIASFNQEISEQKKTKDKKTKYRIALFTMLGIIVAAVVAVFTVYNRQANIIIEEINSLNPSHITIEKDYKELAKLGQNLYREKIVNSFINMVSANPYINSAENIIDENELNKYKTYKAIGEVLNITSDDGTNVMEHINSVLELEAYVSYSGIINCVAASFSDYNKFCEYYNSACDYFSYYTYEIYTYYMNYAKTYIDNAVVSAITYSSGDKLCTTYIDALKTIEKEVRKGYLSMSIMTIYSSRQTVVDTATVVFDVSDSIENIVNSIPEIY